MSFAKILVVDDEVAICRLVEHRLRKQGYAVSTAGRLGGAMALLENEHFDLVLLDFHLPDGDGLDLLKRTMQSPAPPVMVMVSACTSLEVAIQCIRAGAFDYMLKPFSIGEFDTVIERAIERREELQNDRVPAPPRLRPRKILGDSPPIQHLRDLIQKVAPTDVTVLITGESGVGKRRIAEALHSASARSSGPLLRINCLAGDEEELERALFGIAVPEEKSGLLETARGGTVVLEEIADLPLRLQAKLVEVLQENSFERAGGDKPVELDVRLVATTSKDLPQCVLEGIFRQELLLYLNVFPLQAPPLRERISDLPLLVADCLADLSSRNALKPGEISNEAMELLTAYCWPGNITELVTALERAALTVVPGQRIEASAFRFLGSENTKKTRLAPSWSSIPKDTPAPFIENEGPLLTLDELEKKHVLRTLEHTHQNRTRAANLLNISVRTLRNKLHQYRAELSSTSTLHSNELPLISPAAVQKRSVTNGSMQ